MRLLKVYIMINLCVLCNYALADSDKLNSIDEVITKFREITTEFRKEKNHRLIFATTYLDSTVELKREIEKNSFYHPVWVESIVVDFANLYIGALKNYDQQKKTAISWDAAFKINDEKYHKLSVQLILAMNAHIYHDLPIALVKSFDRGYEPELVKRDFGVKSIKLRADKFEYRVCILFESKFVCIFINSLFS